ncbi:MAG: DUF6263 family protein [Gemmataceae bacterium]
MLLRRLVAGLLALGLLACLAVPAVIAQDKDKAKEKKEEKKEDKGGGGDKVTLKWKFDKDKTFFQKMVTKTVQTMKVMNNDVNQTQNQTFYFSFKPTKVENDKVTIEQKIIGVAMDIEIGGSKINYDSTKDTTANNPLGDFFKALVDSTFTIELDTKTLTVTKVEGRDAFIQKLVAANPQMKPLLEVILSNDALKEMAEPTFAVVPAKADAAKGEKWKRTTKLDMGPIGKYENEYNYTLESADKDAAKIKVDTVLNYKEPGDVAGQGGLPFKIKSAKLKSSNPVGEITFSPSKGRLEKSNTKLELKGELSIEIGGQATKVDLSQTQESTIETSDQDPLPKKK